MRIGIITSGTIHSYKDQSIKTKFLTIGIPLFPTESMYLVGNKEGFNLPVNRESAGKGLARITLPILAFLVISLYKFLPTEGTIRYWCLAGAIVCAFVAAYHWLTINRLEDEERKTRDVLGRVFEYNMLPSLLPKELQLSFFKRLIDISLRKYGVDYDWEKAIQGGIFRSREEVELLFAIALYTSTMSPKEKFVSQYEKMKKELEGRIYPPSG